MHKRLEEIKMKVLKDIDDASKIVVYISGPISAYPGSTVSGNLKEFNKFEQLLVNQNFHPINPASVGDLESEGLLYDDILDMWLEIIEHEKIESFYMLPNWTKSTGARKEHQVAVEMRKNIIYVKEILE